MAPRIMKRPAAACDLEKVKRPSGRHKPGSRGDRSGERRRVHEKIAELELKATDAAKGRVDAERKVVALQDALSKAQADLQLEAKQRANAEANLAVELRRRLQAESSLDLEMRRRMDAEGDAEQWRDKACRLGMSRAGSRLP